MPQLADREQRWAEERNVFDLQAELSLGRVGLIDQRIVNRYAKARRIRSKEFRFRLLGNLTGKKILDVGCNDGENSLLLARLGATVTGVDLSPVSIKVAEKSAALNGLSGSAQFICSPVETLELQDEAFDVVWCHCFLHHVIDELPLIMKRLTAWTRPTGIIVISEPVNLCQPLRELRQLLPLSGNVTPGERPLQEAEVHQIAAHLIGARTRSFRLLAWLEQLLPRAESQERCGPARRAILNALCAADYLLLSLPFINRLGSSLVIYGSPRKNT